MQAVLSKFRVLFSLLFGVFALLAVGLSKDSVFEWYRAHTYREDRSIGWVDWYSPKEKVPGAAGLLVASPSNRDKWRSVVAWLGERSTLAFLVSYRGRLIFEHYWGSFSEYSYSDSASMAKTVLGLVVGQSIDLGLLSGVDAKVAPLLPEFEQLHPELSVEHLLTMSSGMGGFGKRSWPESSVGKALFTTDLLRLTQNLGRWKPPDMQFRYNNFDSQILMILVERLSGKRYAELLSETLWAPVGNADAWLYLDRGQGTAHGYCCLFAQPKDWLRIGQLIAGEGKLGEKRVVSEDWVRQMKAPSRLSSKYGYHLWRGSRTGHVVISGRNYQLVYIDPERDLVFVRIGERPAKWDPVQLPKMVMEVIDRGVE